MKLIKTSSIRQNQTAKYIFVKDFNASHYVIGRNLTILSYGSYEDRYGKRQYCINVEDDDAVRNTLVLNENMFQYLSKEIDTLVNKVIKIKSCQKSDKGYWALDAELYQKENQ